ncbi:thioredoxin family protein [Oceanobacillus sp. J11TS1]|uniref:thioredoxin family protein n=1 Tax=Oceanobacillus sp. J11TS1 TaxID=2807191 RepID=UPI001B105458|nr:thioredoxin family protein [Oceanobacillus sp. J11TS1]GIO23715.1 thioredoxin-like protein YusE [Oceanobacillus sp. J11TS1]
MKQFNETEINNDRFILYIYTPFCGTCSVARAMLENVERMQQEIIFTEMNASMHPEFMQNHKVESVPCLAFMEDGQMIEKVYTFQSTANIYQYLMKYKPELFASMN